MDGARRGRVFALSAENPVCASGREAARGAFAQVEMAGMHRLSKYALSFILPVLILLLWFWVSEAGFFPPLLLPGPDQVARRAVELLYTGELARHAASSMARVMPKAAFVQPTPRFPFQRSRVPNAASSSGSAFGSTEPLSM